MLSHLSSGAVSIVPVLSTSVAKTGGLFVTSFSSEHKGLESIVRAESEKQPGQGMFPSDTCTMRV